MKTVYEVLNAVTEADDGAMIVRPANKKDLKLLKKDLIKMEIPPIPQGYADFLAKLNGFAWSGIEFYGTDEELDIETAYMLKDIISANEVFIYNNEGLEHCVQLGCSDEDLFVYNTQNRRYEVLDMTSRDVMEDFETFEAMFYGVVWSRI
jgi:hypothetical protein